MTITTIDYDRHAYRLRLRLRLIFLRLRCRHVCWRVDICHAMLMILPLFADCCYGATPLSSRARYERRCYTQHTRHYGHAIDAAITPDAIMLPPVLLPILLFRYY